MKSARVRALLIGSLIIAGAIVTQTGLITRNERETRAMPQMRRSDLLVLTSLPLMFGEDFSLNSNGSQALKQLESRYRLVPISVTDRVELAKGRLLLMAQPRAQTAENLVELDAWVRGGGRLLLLADPLLEWPSRQPLGDVTRPPSMFMDTGLLAHWGLRLDLPDRRGPAQRVLADYKIITTSPGTLHGACKISADLLVARCRIGAGEAMIIADSDFLNVAELGSEGRHNIDGLLAELASLEQS